MMDRFMDGFSPEKNENSAPAEGRKHVAALGWRCIRCKRETPIDYCSRGPCPMVPTEEPETNYGRILGLAITLLGLIWCAILVYDKAARADAHERRMTRVDAGMEECRLYVREKDDKVFYQTICPSHLKEK